MDLGGISSPALGERLQAAAWIKGWDSSTEFQAEKISIKSHAQTKPWAQGRKGLVHSSTVCRCQQQARGVMRERVHAAVVRQSPSPCFTPCQPVSPCVTPCIPMSAHVTPVTPYWDPLRRWRENLMSPLFLTLFLYVHTPS